MSNSLDPVQARQKVGPDLGAKCLQRLSADDNFAPCRQRVKVQIKINLALLNSCLCTFEELILDGGKKATFQ